MRKIDFKKLDKTYLKISLYIFAVAAAVILFEKIIGHLPGLSNVFHKTLNAILRLGSPFFIGYIIAYVMNPFMKFFEQILVKLFPKTQKHRKLLRTGCILVNYVIIIGGICWISIYLIPELKDSVLSFVSQLSTYSDQLNTTITNFFDRIGFINGDDVTNIINKVLAPILGIFQNVPQLISNIASNLYSVGKITVDIIMGIFISFYMLYDKENFKKHGCRIVYALTNRRKAAQMFDNAQRINLIFQNFIVGKAVDSLIIGIIAFIGFSLLNAPFPLILSLIIGVSNMLPYFGPFIGAIPAALITFLVNPITALWVILFILALQQFDGNFLGPKILGNSLDISPIWIILAVVLGGAFMGPLGMFIGVPIMATCKMFLSEYINRKYQAKYAEDDPLALKNEAHESSPEA
ncbi:AI-2 transport protein TqsA [Anaerotignum neopropionicum]|uniref:AI-2 transport protein TqsA n=1 Tax=Anaerotignum neopropionicum TaxID=36847 RepID=A0A136WBV4_9FIRM|nr:AI-2E family transporter [Anaerotignum neopropionicum]KXL51985.1 AI-2 transport protein TqsA [Anaerotignum neopropionicum]